MENSINSVSNNIFKINQEEVIAALKNWRVPESDNIQLNW